MASTPPYGYKLTPEWEHYYDLMRDWREDIANWEAGNLDLSTWRESFVSRVTSLRARAEALSNEIEEIYFRRKSDVRATLERVAGGMNILDHIEVDADRIVDSRFYVITYVTDWGEESAPSKVTDMIEVDQYGNATVTRPSYPQGRHIERWRVYRSNVGTETAAFQFVDDVLINQQTFTDNLKGEQLGEPCPTLAWAEPPYRWDNSSPAEVKPPKGNDPFLRGVVGMPNGIVAGFIDNFVAFCHPYHPYAWPVEYQITTEWPIVGLGVFGQTLFVGTMGQPYFISGADSASMSAEKLPFNQPCISRRSIASVGNGVIYASPDGLCLASPAGVQVVTAGLFAQEDWQALQPEQIVAEVHERVYYFQTSAGCWALDFEARKLTTVDVSATAFFRDVVTDGLYAVVGDRVQRLFNQGRRTGTWKTGKMVLEKQAPLAWLQVDGDQDVVNPVTVRWYGDGQLRYTVALTDIEPVRLPPGRWLEHEIEVESDARLTKVVLASSTAELKSLA